MAKTAQATALAAAPAVPAPSRGHDDPRPTAERFEIIRKTVEQIALLFEGIGDLMARQAIDETDWAPDVCRAAAARGLKLTDIVYGAAWDSARSIESLREELGHGQ